MTVRIFVLGFVQGVGFRRFIKRKAVSLGLKGWVTNTKDGRVEILVQGSNDQINELKKTAEKGSIFSDVKDIVVEVQNDEEKFESFEIIF